MLLRRVLERGFTSGNIPGGPPYAQVEIHFLFKDLLGEEIFDCLAKTRLSLTLTSLDLMSQMGME